MRVILELTKPVLEKLEQLALLEKRSRKNYMELTLQKHSEVLDKVKTIVSQEKEIKETSSEKKNASSSDGNYDRRKQKLGF